LFCFLDTQAQEPPPGPVVVHCSAGIGRTGTFLSIDIGLEALQAAGEVDVEGIILKLRSQRAGMVQTQGQYEFIYQALVEAVQTGKV
jgi:protein tyrosine phosphatase